MATEPIRRCNVGGGSTLVPECNTYSTVHWILRFPGGHRGVGSDSTTQQSGAGRASWGAAWRGATLITLRPFHLITTRRRCPPPVPITQLPAPQRRLQWQRRITNQSRFRKSNSLTFDSDQLLWRIRFSNPKYLTRFDLIYVTYILVVVHLLRIYSCTKENIDSWIQ